MTVIQPTGVRRILMTTAALAILAGCAENSLNGFDFDLRDLGDGFDTSDAVANIAPRPAPDDRGVISYPNYQVVLAQKDDTIRAIAGRLGMDAASLASFNGIDADLTLRRDEVIALPARVSEPSPATGAASTGPIQPLDVSAVATTALDRVDAQAPAAVAPAAPARQSGAEPVRYQVGRGDTAYTIARQFNVPVASIAEWNSLGADLAIREGQFLLIPQSTTPSRPASVAAAPVTTPGAGSQTPVPPSASTPLPEEAPEPAPAPEAPNLGATTTTPAAPAPAPAASSNAQLVRPVAGTIIRAYAAGRNEGIDIGVPSGTTVKAADAGSVAAVTTDTSGVAIVVIKHAGNLLTVYTNLADLSVAKGDTVSRGQAIAKVGPGDPSFLHFEVRRGLQSVDPADFF
ncbi:murein DD-endopeptidase MepM/ murein hydrolase activator NlpD [Loktanella ponticola]|uniref:Murein DD-endopeptidase MepM/ murein hydrolase activator NlpD n=1 Tax=Yoonia ponticola TaxID=1524255 RepID=A0A7W9BJX4_9RHOB|nr:peptidoglycan DD-metalloendopeptidase family protein [Yoonia ponticola]MBB5721805.1 murein DD-endopeptidase MepM/ murein hydrolase activator NlpD [Yoonia ponticola]